MTGIDKVYRYARLAHYKKLFAAVRERPGSLSATEAFAVEVIYLLDNPTLGEFADFIGISQPNATYKVSALTAKGYIEKTASADRRERRLSVTEKFLNYYGSESASAQEIIDAAGAQLSEKQAEALVVFERAFRGE